ncbi:MAG TPA: glycosyltransferase family 2 protein [Acidimicrobiales bacterium]|nr:glycosyltransferase family 2 protein [Acidimicrobiales bacterium]
MESRAPAVVAVVVTTGPGPGLEATVASLAAQDYPELSLLIVANGEHENVAARVAALAPQAFVRQLEENRGFAAACNEAALMVEGATFLLFCHDDVRLDPDAVTQMVASAYRTNAGIVTPKFVDYDDPLVLLHVGQNSDRFGVVQERVEVGEIDHGQQDLERDVFVAPGGVTLVRGDLFATLRGFDPLILALGEDLDLGWRAQVAGARIVVAPAARVAHRESIARGERAITAKGVRRSSRKDLQRRHQLRVVATGWGKRYTTRTLLTLAAMEVVEFVVALLGRDTDRAGAIVGSWRWLFHNRERIRERRRERSRTRVLSDADLHRLQIGGATRLKKFVVTLVRDGLDRARGILPPEEIAPDEGPEAGVGFAAAFSESEEFDEIAESEELALSRHPSRLLTSFRSQAAVLAVMFILWALGSRNLVAMHLPLLGRLTPLDSWWTTWRHFFASWSSTGTGTSAPGMPGYAVLGFAGTFVFGRMGILPRLALIVAVPLGAIGVARLLKGRVSNRARVVAVVAYFGGALGLNMINQGRIDVLVVVAGLPFVVRRLFDLLGVAGFRQAPGAPIAFGVSGWRASEAGQRMILVILVAAMSALAPATLVVVAVIVLGATMVGRNDESRPVRLTVSVLVSVAIFLAPLTIDTILAGRRALEVFGLARGAWSGPTFLQLVRGADGSFGTTWWGWLAPAAALIGLALTRGERRPIAARFAAIAALSLILATLSLRHWMGPFTPDVDVLLALYGVMLAGLVGLGVSAIELDLRQASFGWRQLGAGALITILVVSIVPLVLNTASGRFDLPTTSVSESMSALAPAAVSSYRVLWLGDPSVLPLAGFSVEPGLAAATSQNGLPGGSTLFAAPGTGPTSVIATSLDEALAGRTVRLGELLASAGISSIVVMNSAAPEIADVQSAPERDAPAGLAAALARQSDLSLVLTTRSASIYADAAFHGVLSQGTSTSSGPATQVALPGSTFGPLALNGTPVTAAMSPASAFSLEVPGRRVTRGASGWAPTFSLSGSGSATGHLVVRRFPFNGILAGLTLCLWAVVWLGFGWLQRLEWLLRIRSQRLAIARHARRDDA